MLTRNGTALSGWNYNQSRRLKSINGDLINCSFSNSQGSIFARMNPQFGTGNTAPSHDDYNLESPITGITVVTKTDTHSVANLGWDEGYSYFGVYSVRNDNAFAVTVSEIGLYTTFNNDAFLVTRDIYTPTVLEPGEIYTFSIVVK